MLSEQTLKERAQFAIRCAPDFDAEVLISSGQNALTRFGENIITQNVASESVGLSLRLIKSGKMGKASTGNLSDDGIRKCAETAITALKVSENDDSILPLLSQQAYKVQHNYFDSTVNLSPDGRAAGVITAVELCKQQNLTGAGNFTNDAGHFGIANSNGLWAYHEHCDASMTLSARTPDSSGWARDGDSDVSKINIDRMSHIAVKKALDGREPVNIDPGKYTVVFEPAAVADFLLFLGWEAFNGKAYVENRSCFSGKVGEKVLGDNITIVDDAFHDMSKGYTFDFEGMPRKRVVMVENGVFKGTVHDRMTARLAGMESTGHALPQPDTNGPMPLNVILSPGKSSLEEMIASVKHGLLVTRLHYTNILDPLKMMLTGMTRDGLFMIENGKVTKGVKNMRFTDSILRVLLNVEALSKNLHKTETFWGGGGTVVPAMMVKDFQFTSRTEN